MNHYVPDFETDDDYSIYAHSGLPHPQKLATGEDDIMELLWENGQVVAQSQTQRSNKKLPPLRLDDAGLQAEHGIRSSSQHGNHHDHHHHQQQQQPHQSTTDNLFMQEDEMASWLHYPLNEANFDGDFCTDLLYSAPCATSTSTAQVVSTAQTSEPRQTVLKPPIPPSRRTDKDTLVQSFGHFSRKKLRIEPTPSIAREPRVDSSVAPVASKSTEGPSNRINARETMNVAAVATTSSVRPGGPNGLHNRGNEDNTTYDVSVTSSPGDSTASAQPAPKSSVDDRKRKGREMDDTELHSEEVGIECTDAKKQSRGSTSTKRSRAAEVHNLSERKRRDRINEKMKALQELIPRCNKSDKASMLDEAIEYLKALQMQVQMMSMGCGFVPMMFPGVQQYMTPVGIGMNMGMDMGMNRPLIPFPNVLAGSALPTPASTSHLDPRFPGFHMPPVSAPDSTIMQSASQSNPMVNSFGVQNPIQPRHPNFSDPYQQYASFHQMQSPAVQNLAAALPNSSKPSTITKEAEKTENNQGG